MDHFAGLDVSVKETSVCIVDDTGKIVREVKVASEPEASVGGAEEPRLPLQANWVARCLRCRRPASANSSPTKPISGPR